LPVGVADADEGEAVVPVAVKDTQTGVLTHAV
jgi:hypothetical protein